MLELTAAEQGLVREICQQHARQLLTEIDHTDNRNYKAGLVDKSRILDAVLGKLEQSDAVPKP